MYVWDECVVGVQTCGVFNVMCCWHVNWHVGVLIDAWCVIVWLCVCGSHDMWLSVKVVHGVNVLCVYQCCVMCVCVWMWYVLVNEYCVVWIMYMNVCLFCFELTICEKCAHNDMCVNTVCWHNSSNKRTTNTRCVSVGVFVVGHGYGYECILWNVWCVLWCDVLLIDTSVS